MKRGYRNDFASTPERTISKSDRRVLVGDLSRRLQGGAWDRGRVPDLRNRSRILALGLALYGLLTGCSEHPETAIQSDGPENVHRVAVSRVEQGSLPTVYPAPGTIVPGARLQVASRISGFIERMFVDEGDRVAAGATLLEIDDSRVEADIRGAQATLASAAADLADAKADVVRYEALARTQALAEDQLAKARLRRAQADAQVAKAQADLDAGRQDRRYTRILSPTPAEVRERLRDPGDLVTPGEPILRLDVLGTLELEVYLPAARLEDVAVGQTVEVEVAPGPPRLIGRVTALVHAADPVTRRSKVRISLPEDAHVVPGQFGRAFLVLGHEPATLLPATAVTERAGVPGVFVVDETERVRFRSVRLGRAGDGIRELLAGPESGSLVVLNPPASLRDGARIARTGIDEP